MDGLNNKQKTVFLVLIIAMVAVIGIYIFQNADKNSYVEIQEDEILVTSQESKQIEEESEIVIHITGCVETEGIVKLKEGSRIADAIEASGGLTMDANIKNVNLAYILQDGQKLYIPSNIEDEQETYITNENGEDIIKDEPNITGSSGQKININTATQAELETIPGIGPSTASKIIEYRKNGKFGSIEDIKNVSGIGDSKFNSMKDYISVK